MKFLELLNRIGLIAAHRGARSIAPENTLTALKKSVGKCDFIEIDVQLSRDGAAVVMHDDTLERTTNVSEMDLFKKRSPYRVSDFTLDELRMLDYGSWFYKDKNHKEPLLTLGLALEFIREKGLFMNVEIKDMHGTFSDERVVESVVKEIVSADVDERILLSSFRHEYLRMFKEKLPNVPTAVLVEDKHPQNLIKYLRDLRADAYHVNDKSVDEKTVKKLREEGYFVGVYTVNDANRAKELFNMGVNAIFSDSLKKDLEMSSL